MDITDKQFKRISDLIYNRAGIHLTGGKKNLVVVRLTKVIKSLNFNSFDEYIDYVEKDNTNQALLILINKISTNHTYFWREKGHFEYYAQVLLPEIVKKKKASGDNDIRIWCAGCSFGDEAYTLMMLMMEYFGYDYSNWSAGLLATDISTDALTKAVRGEYPQERLRDLPPDLLRKYFKKTPEGTYKVSENLKKEIVFRRFNLMSDVFPFKKPFDVIFCRNVMIYFDKPTRDNLVRKFSQHTVPGGHLFIGHSESIGRDCSFYEYVKPALYRKK
jgi:chemotaxis protein methyltransferase CheR